VDRMVLGGCLFSALLGPPPTYTPEIMRGGSSSYASQGVGKSFIDGLRAMRPPASPKELTPAQLLSKLSEDESFEHVKRDMLRQIDARGTVFANAGHLVESAQLKDMKAAIAKRKPSAGSEFSEGGTTRNAA